MIPKEPGVAKGDYAYALAKAGISQLPIVGAPIAEILPLIIAPPLERRRAEWLRSLGERLKLLEEKVAGFRLENLQSNETFVTTATHASQIAIRNHQKEKLEALQNAVLNAALPNAPEEDLQLMFLNFVDSFTPWHLAILKFFDNPKEWGQRHAVAFSEHYYMGSPGHILEEAFPNLKGKREYYDLFVKDLFSHGLMSTDSLHMAMTESGMFASRTTAMGKQFLTFISSPLEQEARSSRAGQETYG
jgi:hypothetical protein